MRICRKVIIIVLIWTLALSSLAYGVEPQNISRVDFVKEILKVMDVEIDRALSSPFNDILNNEDIPYLATAFNKKIITGNKGNFNPQKPITNEQAVITVVRALGVININQDEASKTEISFSDTNQISEWARPYVAYAIKYGLIENSQNKFNPQLALTNLQSKEILSRFKEAFVKEGLTAAQVLVLADNNLNKYGTYELRGTISESTNAKQPTDQQETVVINVQQGSPQLSSQQLEIARMYARYGEDVNIDGEEYYVIKIDLDPETFMEMYNKIIEEKFDNMLEGEAWEKIKKENGVPEVMDEEIFKSILKTAAEQTLENMDIQITQEYYIHKENKSYSRLITKQIANMSLMGVETKVEINGQFEYYGFGEKKE